MTMTVTTDDNKAAISRLLEAASSGNIEVLDALTTPEIVIHGDAAFPLAQGREALRNGMQAFHAAFPDATITVERMFGEADKVVTHFLVSGTHTGQWLGAAPTNRAVRWTASAIARFTDGKLAEAWMIQDELGLMQQLGLVPAP